MKDRIVKGLFLVDLEKNIIGDNENNEFLLSRVKNFDLPIEFKKIIVVHSSYYKYYNEKFDFRPILPICVPVPAMHTSYIGSQELITGYPFEHVYSLITKIENDEFEFSGYDVVSIKTVKKFYKDLLENGYFEKYLEFLSVLFKIGKKEFSETIQNNDNKTIENMLVKKMKKEIIGKKPKDK